MTHITKVLSIQSHVVSGYVGNKCACFPLQLLGFEVDFINSVQFSNHTGYKHIKGQVLNSEDIQDLYDGLKANNLVTFSYVVTGYVGNVTFLSKLAEIIKELKEINPKLSFVCDPVMGDNGKLYVPPDILPVYRDILIPIADIITPNQFEAELLTGISIQSEEDVIKSLNKFHEMGVKTVVMSSVQMPNVGNLFMYGSSVGNSGISVQEFVWMEIPVIDGSFTGTGDLFSALLLAWMAKTGGNLQISCQKAVNTIQCVLKRTKESASGFSTPASMELKLVQSKADIENPPDLLVCSPLQPGIPQQKA